MKFDINTTRLGVLLLTTAGLAGCALPDPVRLSDEPLALAPPPEADEAVDLRDYPQTSALYESGDVVAGSTVFWVETDPDRIDDPGEALLQPVLFVVNAVTTPVAIFLPPPWEAVTHDAVRLPTTSTVAVRQPGASLAPMSPSPMMPDMTDEMDGEMDSDGRLVDLVPEADIEAADTKPDGDAPETTIPEGEMDRSADEPADEVIPFYPRNRSPAAPTTRPAQTAPTTLTTPGTPTTRPAYDMNK